MIVGLGTGPFPKHPALAALTEAGVVLEARAALVKLRTEKPSEQLLIFS
jgi:hypothetical protein